MDEADFAKGGKLELKFKDLLLAFEYFKSTDLQIMDDPVRFIEMALMYDLQTYTDLTERERVIKVREYGDVIRSIIKQA